MNRTSLVDEARMRRIVSTLYTFSNRFFFAAAEPNLNNLIQLYSHVQSCFCRRTLLSSHCGFSFYLSFAELSSLLIRFWATKILELRALLQNDKIRCGGRGRNNKCFYMLFTISAEILAFMGKHKKWISNTELNEEPSVRPIFQSFTYIVPPPNATNVGSWFWVG